ncbi:hypothetical protein C8R45DRAFT_923261, partial [Mycena sanguinolenta]
SAEPASRQQYTGTRPLSSRWRSRHTSIPCETKVAPRGLGPALSDTRVSDRSSRNARRVTATERAKHARTADEKVQAAEQVLADVQAADESTSVDHGTVPDEMISVPALNTEEASRPQRKRSGSASLQSDEPPKHLKLGPLKGWGVERNGVIMSTKEYAQTHWSEF